MATTERLITNTFRELVCVEPIEKITVSEICQHAGIARKTFYRYFETGDDLLKHIIRTDLCEPAKNLFPLFGSDEAIVSTLFLQERVLQGLYDKKEFYVHLAARSNGHAFVKALQACIFDLMEALFPAVGRDYSEKYHYAARFLVSGQTSLIVQWIREGMELTPAQMSTWLCEWSMPSIWVIGNPSKSNAHVEFELK